MADDNWSEWRNQQGCYKSKAEVQIARFLERNGNNYRYERPLAMIERGKVRLWCPVYVFSKSEKNLPLN